jgi:SAM-dependent methyltransferase
MSLKRFAVQHSDRRSDLGPLPIEYFNEYALGTILCPENFHPLQHLDIGSGTGRVLKNLIHLFSPIETTAIDPNLNLTNLTSGHKVNLVKEDFLTYKFSNLFDFITCVGVLMHMPDQIEALRKIKSLLSKNGVALLWVYQYLPIPIQMIIFLLRKIILKLNLKGTMISDSVTILLYLPLFRISKSVRDLTNKDFKEVRLVIFDQLNADFVRYFKRDELEDVLMQAGFMQFTIIETGNRGWTILLENS